MRESAADQELVNRAVAGDEAAFVALCDRYRGRVWRIAVSVARRNDAEDLAQEAVIRAFTALRGYRGEAPFEAWLCRIALNVAHDYHRSAWRRRVSLFDLLPVRQEEPAGSPDRDFERLELHRRVRREVASLPESMRVPIWLHYFEGFTLAQVSRLEGIPEGTLRSRVRAGLKRLSLCLGEWEVDDAGGHDEPGSTLVPQQKGCSA